MPSEAFLRGLERELRRSFLPLWVLEELGEGRPMYGYELMGRLSERGGTGFTVPPSVLYPVLARLRSWGYVESFHGVESRGPVRKYYRLTQLGGAALRSARDLSSRLQGSRPELTPPRTPTRPLGRPT